MLFCYSENGTFSVQVLAHVQRHLSPCCRSRDKSNQRMSPTSGVSRMITVAGRRSSSRRKRGDLAVSDCKRPRRMNTKRSMINDLDQRMIQLQTVNDADFTSSQNSSPMI